MNLKTLNILFYLKVEFITIAADYGMASQLDSALLNTDIAIQINEKLKIKNKDYFKSLANYDKYIHLPAHRHKEMQRLRRSLLPCGSCKTAILI